ncbi:terminase [Serratia sp. Leaf50]|nr:terminase [Serratia sp. Leaf50]
MSTISNLGDAYHWSVAKIAEAFGLNRSTVKKRLLDANTTIAATVRGNPVYALKDIGPILFAADAPAGPERQHDPSTMSPKDRKDWFQSENERVKLEASLKQLVPASDVHREMALILKSVSQVLDTWPDKLERDRGWLPDQIAEAQRAIDEIREVMAAEILTAEDVYDE